MELILTNLLVVAANFISTFAAYRTFYGLKKYKFMCRKIFLLFSTLFFSCLLIGQKCDSTYYPNLSYNSDFEKEVFNKLNSGEFCSFDMFLALDNTISKIQQKQISNRFNLFIEQCKKKEIKSPNHKKNITKAYKSAHKTFLKKYLPIVGFSEIFKSGTYNCVSGTALYAMIFDTLGIDFIIKEMPGHVYLICNPKSDQIRVEATLPEKGAFSLNEYAKKTYVDHLKRNKIISEAEAANLTVNEVFDKYYYSDKDISLRELAGIQYINAAIQAFENKSYMFALSQLEKSQVLAKRERNLFMINSCLEFLLAEKEDKLEGLDELLFKFANYNDNAFINNRIVGYFEELAHRNLVNNPDTAGFSKFHHLLTSKLIDQKLKDEIDFVFHYYFGTYFLLKKKFKEALSEFSNAHQINKENLKNQSGISESLVFLIVNKKNHEKSLEEINSYMEKFPFILNDERIQQLLVYNYMRIVGDYFRINDYKSGIKFLDEFERVLEDLENFEPDGDMVSYGYGEAFYFYVRRQNYKKAKTFIDRGLKAAPYSFELKRKLQSLKEYINY